jgi:hypothetical protein
MQYVTAWRMPLALRSNITLSPAPLEDAEDGFLQVELPSFGLSEHRTEITVQTVSKQTLLGKWWWPISHAMGVYVTRGMFAVFVPFKRRMQDHVSARF